MPLCHSNWLPSPSIGHISLGIPLIILAFLRWIEDFRNILKQDLVDMCAALWAGKLDKLNRVSVREHMAAKFG